MRSALAAFLLARVVTAILTPVARRVALAIGAVDEPGARRVHARRVPRMGGIAIVIGFFVPLLAMLALHTSSALILFSTPLATRGLVLGSVLVVGLGLLDDIRGVGAKMKLLVQTAAAVVSFECGMRIESITLPWIGVLNLGWFALPATTLWVVGIVNAINLIDGLDGLAAGVAFFACFTNFALSLLTGNVFISIITASLGGAVVGFLFYNFNPARIFMGDSGSMFLGFILASASLLGAGTQKSPTLVAIVAPVLALGLPITDMLLTIARRFFERRSIFAADRGHIHHRLLDMGLTHRRAVLSLYMVSVVFTILALMVYFGRSWQIGAAFFALTALLVGVVRFVGYFNSSLVAAGRAGGEELCDALRRSVPRVLRRMSEAHASEQLPGILAAFGEETGFLAIGIRNGNNERLKLWRWESPKAGSSSAEATCGTFAVSGGGESLSLQFFLDSAAGIIGPQTRILLQLVADAASGVLVAAAAGALPEPSVPRSDRVAQGAR